MPDHDKIYTSEADKYDLLISKEDYMQNIPKALSDITSFEGLDVVDLGAGTGRLTCMLAPLAKSITALDVSKAMLDVTAEKLARAQLNNWQIKVSDHRSLPLPEDAADVAIAGWTICYVASSNVPGWKRNLDSVLSEMKRIVRQGGTIIILETMGTGYESPCPPDFLKAYYHSLEHEYGFSGKWIRTDYKFETVEEAERLTRFFFGDELADRVKSENVTVLPECTGIWWTRV